MPDSIEVNALKQWTGKTTANIIFDSTIDEFTYGDVLTKVQGKENTAIIGFTTDGDVFGVFDNIPLDTQKPWLYDQHIFVFSFESHGRCATPQRFPVKKSLRNKAGVGVWKNPGRFVQVWVGDAGCFYLGDERGPSYCWDLGHVFEGLEDTTLTGQNNTDHTRPPYHHCSRLVVVQLV